MTVIFQSGYHQIKSGEIAYMVNTLCTKEGDIKTSGFRESNFNQIVVVNYQINLLLGKGPIEVISYKSDL